MRNGLLLVACVGLLTRGGVCQHAGLVRVESARIGPDHRVYLRWTEQPERLQPLGEEQADTEDLRIAPDKSAAAWLVGRTDLSDANYPEPFELMVAWGGRRPRSIFPGRVISQWQFADGGQHIALWDETGHGGHFGKATLYDARTGKQVAEWDPDTKTAPPGWAAPFHAEWDNDNQ